MSNAVLVAFAVILGIGVAGYVLGFGPLKQFGDSLMGKLSAQEIAQFASRAGFTGTDLQTAVAIALAESSGNPQAHGDTGLGSGSGSFGLWQIYSDAHPEFGLDFTTLYDPQTNADAAYSVYASAGYSFSPWSTFKGGQYQAYMGQAGEAVNA